MRRIRKKPSHIAEFLLARLLPDEGWDTPLGDFEEYYRYLIHNEGLGKAKFWYWSQIIKLIPRICIHKIIWGRVMVVNYLRIVLRQFQKQKAFTLINILGLSIGMTVCMLILLWVRNEVSYDRFHEKSDQLFRVMRLSSTDSTQTSVVTPLPLAPAMKAQLPEVLGATRLSWVGRRLLKNKNKVFYENDAYWVDNDFLTMFTFPFALGNPESAFSDPFSIVLTQSMAKKYFGNEDPLGKTLEINNEHRLTVTGVLKEPPVNSIFQFDYLMPFSLYQITMARKNDWSDVSYRTYVHLGEGCDLDQLKKKVSAIIAEHEPQYSGIGFFQPVKDIYYDFVKTNILIFSAVAFIVLTIACINFINLSTARSGRRLKEISMRKVSGAQRQDLIKQFLGESFLYTGLAMGIAIALVGLLLRSFNQMAGTQIAIQVLGDLGLVSGMIGLFLFTGFFAGLYPAFVLSGMRPNLILHTCTTRQSSGSRFKKTLVVVQFALSTLLIFGTGVIVSQLDFIRGMNPGFDTEQILTIPLRGGFQTRPELIKNELLSHPQILKGTFVDRLPMSNTGWGTDSPTWEGKVGDQRVQFTVRIVDFDYLNTFDIQVTQGRFFSENITTDKAGFVLNEAAVKAMGMNQPLGKWFHWWDKRGPIIGVVEDFHFNTIHNEIEPLFLQVLPQYYRTLCLKVRPDQISDTIGFIEKTWQSHVPDFPFEFSFLDQTIDRMYRTEERLAKIFRVASAFAVIVACMGLLGMVSFVVEQRTKEIGIRKVLGSTIPGVVIQISNEFIKWVLIANLIAWPVGYFIMTGWIRNFAYRTNIGLSLFLVSGLLPLILAILTVAYQAIKAARINPVDSLRYE